MCETKDVKTNASELTIRTKPFNLEEAKKGAAVCTVEGHPVRLLCFDRLSSKDGEAATRSLSLVGLVLQDSGGEACQGWTKDGCYNVNGAPSREDLRMPVVRHSGWIAHINPGEGAAPSYLRFTSHMYATLSDAQKQCNIANPTFSEVTWEA